MAFHDLHWSNGRGHLPITFASEFFLLFFLKEKVCVCVLYKCLHVCECSCVYARVYEMRSEDNLRSLVVPFYHVRQGLLSTTVFASLAVSLGSWTPAHMLV